MKINNILNQNQTLEQKSFKAKFKREKFFIDFHFRKQIQNMENFQRKGKVFFLFFQISYQK